MPPLLAAKPKTCTIATSASLLEPPPEVAIKPRQGCSSRRMYRSERKWPPLQRSFNDNHFQYGRACGLVFGPNGADEAGSPVCGAGEEGLPCSTWAGACSGPAPQPRVDDGMAKQIVADYVAGSTGRELAERHGLARSTVIGLLRRHGVAVRYPRVTPEQAGEMLPLYRSGVRQVDIAEQFGRDPSNVWHVLKRVGAFEYVPPSPADGPVQPSGGPPARTA
jgi:hypothetical protein